MYIAQIIYLTVAQRVNHKKISPVQDKIKQDKINSHLINSRLINSHLINSMYDSKLNSYSNIINASNAEQYQYNLVDDNLLLIA